MRTETVINISFEAVLMRKPNEKNGGIIKCLV